MNYCRPAGRSALACLNSRDTPRDASLSKDPLVYTNPFQYIYNRLFEALGGLVPFASKNDLEDES